MGLFNFFGKSNTTPQVDAETQQTRNQMKEKLMATLTKNLSVHNFTQSEISEVFSIIEKAEDNIQKLKENLLHIKETSENPTVAIIKIKREVEFIQQQMSADIKTKIRQIKLRKQNKRKERI